MTLNAVHPSQQLSQESTDLIRRYAQDAERIGELHPEWLKLVFEEKWFLLFVPREFGGHAMSLPEALRLEEALAWADGSLGWTITLCAGAGWFSGFWTEDVNEQFFSDPQACICGSGAKGGTATPLDGGYLINGSWKYASGTPHATAFTTNCLLPDGSHRAFVLLPEEIEWQPVWKAMGMVATASHSFTAKDLWVPANRSFGLEPRDATIDHPLYRNPFALFADVTLTVNLSGMARHFLDLIEARQDEIIARYSSFEPALIRHQQRFEMARLLFYEAVEASWEACRKALEISDKLELQTKWTCGNLVAASRQMLQELYPYCGLCAAEYDSEINRIWRDFHTAGQHALFLREFGDV